MMEELSRSNDEGTSPPPRRIIENLARVTRRMLTVNDINPQGEAVLGVEVMSDVLKTLANKLGLEDTDKDGDAWTFFQILD